MAAPRSFFGARATPDVAEVPKNGWLRVARGVYLVVAAVALAVLVWTRRDDLARLTDDARPALAAAALAVAFVQLGLNAAFWSFALRALGHPVPFAGVLSSSSRSLLARYLPGSVWYALGRSALLARDHGAPKRTLAAVAVLETGLSVVACAGLGVALLLGTGRLPGGAGWLAVWGVALVAVCPPPVVNRALGWVAPRRGGDVRRLSWPVFCGLAAWQVLFWASAAACFSLYVNAFPALELRPVLAVAGGFMVAWVLGFLAVFAPQGLGVFEATVVGLIATDSLPATAVVVAGYRAVSLLRDVVALATAEALARRHTPKVASSQLPPR